MKKRKMRRYRTMKRNSGMKFLGFIGIIVGAVICGYLTARFVVAPLLGYETEVLKLDFPSKLTAIVDDNELEQQERDAQEQVVQKQDAQEEEETLEEPIEQKRYVLQFGVFSSESGAKELVQALKKKSIETKVKQADGNYKVVSDAYDSKEDAIEALEKLKKQQNLDVFITTTD